MSRNQVVRPWESLAGTLVADPPKAKQNSVRIELEKLRLKKAGHRRYYLGIDRKGFTVQTKRKAILKLTQTPPLMDVLQKESTGKSESAALTVVVSPHHNKQENAVFNAVGGVNQHNLKINEARFKQMLQGSLVWYRCWRSKD